jgi:UDP-4-amino-4,6-dideoxy-N-acetyl-beta-L-altrosamine transaminase
VSEVLLPYSRQWVSDEDIAAVSEVLQGDWLTTGPTVARFERALADAANVRYAVAMNSGTSALHAMYAAVGIGPGDEIVTSPLTFAATANAALYLGATVRFADVQPDTGNIDPGSVASIIGRRTRAIVAVDFAGHPADYRALRQLTKGSSCTVLADAAHSLGASRNGRPVGTMAAATALSFHPVKSITTGEGGAVVTNSARIAARAQLFRNHGICRDARSQRQRGPWYYEMRSLGFNYRLSDIHAALGISQLRRLTEFVRRRQHLAAMYMERLRALDAIELPRPQPGVESSWHLFVVRVRDVRKRRPLFEYLRSTGLGVQVHYIPVYWHPYYRALGYRRGLCPKAEDFYRRAISLPLFPRMREADVDRVVDALKSGLAKNSRSRT